MSEESPNQENRSQYEDPLDSIGSKPDYAQIAREAGYQNPDEKIDVLAVDTVKKQAKALLGRLQQIFATKPAPVTEQLGKLENLGATLDDSQLESTSEATRDHTESKNILRRIDEFMLNSKDNFLVERWKEQKRFGKFYIPFLVTMLGLSYVGAGAYDWLTSDRSTTSPQDTSTQETPGQASWEQSAVLPTQTGESVTVNPLGNSLEADAPRAMTETEFEAAGFLQRVIQPGDTLIGYAELLGVDDADKPRFVAWIAALNGITNPDEIEAYSHIYLPPSRSQIPVGR